MGLDMYLNKKYYVQNWEHMPESKRYAITILKGGQPSPIPVDKITYIETEEIYWRKANAIHKWFVENVQEGHDDCGNYYVNREQLQELLNACNTILESSKLIKGKIQNGSTFENGKETPILEDGKYIKNPAVAQEILPTQEGFFFGGTAYDQYYFEDILHTKKELERVLAVDDNGTFVYHSSW